MAKPKAIKGFPAAVERIKTLLGAKKMAALVGKSERRVYFWMEEGSDYIPSVRDCLTLDAAFIQAGGKHPPIFDAYEEMLAAIADERPCPDDLRPALADAARECGEAIAAACALGPDATEEQHRTAHREISEGITSLAELSRQVLASLKEATA